MHKRKHSSHKTKKWKENNVIITIVSVYSINLSSDTSLIFLASFNRSRRKFCEVENNKTGQKQCSEWNVKLGVQWVRRDVRAAAEAARSDGVGGFEFQSVEFLAAFRRACEIRWLDFIMSVMKGSVDYRYFTRRSNNLDSYRGVW